MTFLHWVKYPHMMVCVHRTMENGFYCSKYVGGSKVMGVHREFKTREELSTFLLGLPNAPVDEITEFINSLQ